MRTPEEIKKGLELCQHNPYNGLCDCHKGCPYRNIKCDTLRKDALAYIKQLEAQVPKWTSVKERLPEDDDDVLIITEFGISMGYYDIYQDYWVDYTNGDNNIVTYWMPLPEPPKEG